jgi:hypothetical protein
MAQTKLVEETTNKFFMFEHFPPPSKNPAGHEIMLENTVEQGRLNGACPLHAGYLRLQTHL